MKAIDYKYPRVSIVIPVYNGANYLKEAIDSALGQDYGSFEVIVVNDGSNDHGKTEEICLSYGDRIRYFRKANGGVASALNLAIEKANGEYVSWLSHDDAYFPNKLSVQVEYLKEISESQNTILSTDVEIIDERSKHVQNVSLHYESEDFVYELLMRGVINGCTLLIPISAFGSAGGFNEHLKTTQDYDLWLRMKKAGWNFRHIDTVSVKSRMHAEQDSQKKVLLAIKERALLEKFAFETFGANELVSPSRISSGPRWFIQKMKMTLLLRRAFPFLSLIARKVGVYEILSPLWRKYFILKNKD